MFKFMVNGILINYYGMKAVIKKEYIRRKWNNEIIRFAGSFLAIITVK